MQLDIHTYDAVPTTNALVKDAIAAGAPEGAAHVALKQTAGYGRQGRVWVSPYGGVYFSVLLRPDLGSPDLPGLSLVLGLAVRSALEEILRGGDAWCGDGGHADGAGDDARDADAANAPQPSRVLVKWPNDIVVAHCDGADGAAAGTGHGDAPLAKLCGISFEAYRGACCAGIGVNVFELAQDGASASAPSSKYATAYLASLAGWDEACVSPDGLSAAQRDTLCRIARLCLDRIASHYDVAVKSSLTSGGFFMPFQEEYARQNALQGRNVTLTAIDGKVLAQGTVQGVDAQGCLILQEETGTVRHIASGEAHIAAL